MGVDESLRNRLRAAFAWRILAIGAREYMAGADWGAYTVDEVALRHGAGVEEETNDAELAYARFRKSEPTRYRDGWLPSS